MASAWVEFAVCELARVPALARRTCPELAYLQDTCTESKHGQITRYPPAIKEPRHRSGDLCGEDYSIEDFDTSSIENELPDGLTVPFDNDISRALRFWSDFFEVHGIT